MIYPRARDNPGSMAAENRTALLGPSIARLCHSPIVSIRRNR